MKWYLGVLPHEPQRYNGDARVCSRLYPSKSALKKNWDLKSAEIVEVELPDPSAQRRWKVTRRTRYSENVPGVTGNWDLTSRFDISDGYVGISQWEGKEVKNVERVLLTKKQFHALLKFVGYKTNDAG